MGRLTRPLFTEESSRPGLGPTESSNTFGSTYGNRIANGRALRERWAVDQTLRDSAPARTCLLAGYR